MKKNYVGVKFRVYLNFAYYLLSICVLNDVTTIDSYAILNANNAYGQKRAFDDSVTTNVGGGLRISKNGCVVNNRTGTCMFNLECTKRNGVVIGTCLDGFLFGACCILEDTTTLPINLTSPSVPLTTQKNKVESSSSYANNKIADLEEDTLEILDNVLSSINESALILGDGSIHHYQQTRIPTSTHEPVTVGKENINDMLDSLVGNVLQSFEVKVPSLLNLIDGHILEDDDILDDSINMVLVDNDTTLLQNVDVDDELWSNEVLHNTIVMETTPETVITTFNSELVAHNSEEFTTEVTTRPITIENTTNAASSFDTSTSKLTTPLTMKTVITTNTSSTTTTPLTTTPSTTTSKWDYRKDCGVRPIRGQGRIVGGKKAIFGDWPWQVLVKESTWLGLFTKNKCGGVLISDQHVLTAAHCQPGFLASLLVELGEYDISGETEYMATHQKRVKRVIIHRDYKAPTFENDIAILELETKIDRQPHIVPICMPKLNTKFEGRMGIVSGWGRLEYQGNVPNVLHQVSVPIMENKKCQSMFRKSGHKKKVKPSFLCAGYDNGEKDSCEGDSGGPLMVQRSDSTWVLAGTVSHGIKCAYPDMPGIYMRMTYYKPWIERITKIKF